MKDNDVNVIAENLRVVISRLLKILRNQTKDDELHSLTERSTLSVIFRRSKILPSELAAIEKVTAQSMSQILNKLLDHGFIKKSSSETDGRKVIITITSSGRQRIEKRRFEKKEWLTRSILEKTTSEEKKILVSAIKVLTKLVDIE